MANLNDFPKYLGPQAVDCTKETPLTRLSSALERLHKAEAQVSSIANKLVGEPTSGDGCRESRGPVGSGIFGNIEEMADGVAALADDIIEHAARIERRL